MTETLLEIIEGIEYDTRDSFGFFDSLEDHCFCSDKSPEDGCCDCCLAIMIIGEINNRCKKALKDNCQAKSQAKGI